MISYESRQGAAELPVVSEAEAGGTSE